MKEIQTNTKRTFEVRMQDFTPIYGPFFYYGRNWRESGATGTAYDNLVGAGLIILDTITGLSIPIAIKGLETLLK